MAIDEQHLALLKSAVKVIGFITLSILLGLFLLQNVLIYPGAYLPNPKIVNAKVINFEEIKLEAEDGRIVPLYKVGLKENNPNAILLMHGNADTAKNIINRLYNQYILYYYNYDIYAVEYRGFGGSKGIPTEKNILADTLLAAEYIKSKKQYENIVYYGHSLGTGIAVNLAKASPANALILESPFASLADAAKATYPILPKFLLKLMLMDKYDSINTLKDMPVSNVLILHAKDDSVLPVKQARRLFEEVVSPNKEYKEYDHGGHNDIFFINEMGDLKSFLGKLARKIP